MKLKNTINLVLFLLAIGCTNPINKEDRIVQNFPYESPLYIVHGKSDATGTRELSGQIVFEKNNIDIEIGFGDDKKIEKFDIRTVTFENNPNELTYRTNKGTLHVTLDKDAIKTVHWIADGFSMLFSRKKPKKKITTELPLPIGKPMPGWNRIKINEIGTIDLPPEMEIQSRNYKQRTKSYENIMKDYWDIQFNEPVLTFQPKGSNSINIESLSKYARVMYETIYGSECEFQHLNEKISITKRELQNLDVELREQLSSEVKKTSIQLIEWFPVKITEVNGMPALNISYIRQFKNEPLVNVNIYRFQNCDKIHSLTLSYRINEQNYWKHTLQEILKSFRITNIK